MIDVAGISPAVGAALVAGVFGLLQAMLTIYMIRGLDRRDSDDDRSGGLKRRADDVAALDLEKGALPPEAED